MHVTDIIQKALDNKTTRFGFELLPPLKGDGTGTVFEAVEPLTQFDPAYVNITYHREDIKYVDRPDGLVERRIVRRRPGTVGIAAAIMNKWSLPVVPHLICGGNSRYDIEDSLIDLDILGINNVLVLRGDNMKGEKTFSSHPDGHTYAEQLVRQVVDMNNGIFIDGEVENCRHSAFCIGVAGYPEKHSEAPNIDHDMKMLKRKIDAGAHYIVTQMSFDNSRIFEFTRLCRENGINVPVIPGIKPFSTKSQLTMLPQTFHVDLPQDLVKEVEKCKDNKAVREVGVEWAIQQSRELKAAGLPVLHYYSMGKTDNICKIVKAVF